MQISNSANKTALFWSSAQSSNFFLNSQQFTHTPLCLFKNRTCTFRTNSKDVQKSWHLRTENREHIYSTLFWPIWYRHRTAHAVQRESARQSLDSRLYRSLYKYTFNRQQNGCVHSSSVTHSMAAAAEGTAVTDPCTEINGEPQLYFVRSAN